MGEVNYRQRSGKAIMNSMVYFDPETARDCVDGGRCWGSGFDKWARFTQFGVRFMIKAAFHRHGCRTAPMTSRVCRAGALFGTRCYFAPGVVPCTNGVFPLCLLLICLLLYNIVPSCLLHIFSPKIKCLLPNYIIITPLSYVTCSEGLSVHSVRYRPRHFVTCFRGLAHVAAVGRSIATPTKL